MIKISEELSQHLTKAVKSPIFQKFYDKIFKQCFLNLADEAVNEKSLDTLREASGDAETFNFVFNSIFLLTVEAIHCNLLPDETRMLLEEFLNEKEIIESYLSKLNDFRAFVESEDNELKHTKFDSSVNLSKIVDLEWEILHTVATKHLLRISKDIYLIRLKYVTPEGELKNSNFKCNYEELVSLVENLNIACNSVAKICDSVETTKNI